MSGDRRILERYSAEDHQRVETARAAHYDLLRETGYSPARAREVAAEAADKQIASLDRAIGGTGRKVGAPDSGRSRFRVPFPWESSQAPSEK